MIIKLSIKNNIINIIDDIHFINIYFFFFFFFGFGFVFSFNILFI